MTTVSSKLVLTFSNNSGSYWTASEQHSAIPSVLLLLTSYAAFGKNNGCACR